MTIKFRHIPMALLSVAIIYYVTLYPACIQRSWGWVETGAMARFYELTMRHGCVMVTTDETRAFRCNNGEEINIEKFVAKCKSRKLFKGRWNVERMLGVNVVEFIGERKARRLL